MSTTQPYSPKRRRGWPILLGALVGIVLLVIGFATIPLFAGFILLVAALLFALYKVLDWLAKEKNILFTTVEPGQVKFLMRGGRLDEILVGDENRTIDDKHNICRIYEYNSDGTRKERDGKPVTGKRHRDFFERTFGWRYVGFLRYVLRWEMKWYELLDGNDPAKGLRKREEFTDFLFTTRAFTYGARVSAAETIGPVESEEEEPERLSVDVDLAVTLYILNPKIARFDVEDALDRVMTLIVSGARKYIARSSFDSLQQEADDNEDQGLWEFLKRENPVARDHEYEPDPLLIEYLGGHDKYLYFSKYGILVDITEIIAIALVGDPDGKLQEALTARFVAAQNAKAKIVTAEGDKQATILKSEGDKQALENIADGQSKVVDNVYIKAAGSAGVTAAALQAVGDISKAWENRGKKGGGDA